MLANTVFRIRRSFVLVPIAIALVFLVAACGEDPTATPRPTNTPVADSTQPTPTATTPAMAEDLSGVIEIDGSSTVAPVSQAVAEEFQKLHPDVRPVVGVSGTGAGFKRFTVGETDISDASRPIKPSEAEAAAANGIEYLELKVGTDGLSVMVNPENDFVDCLTVGELKAIWEPGSSVSTWKDVRSEWPDDEIRLYGPGTDSGTFDYFTEEIVGEARKSRPDYTPSEDDNVLVLGIYGDENSLGYFGYAYYAENQDKLKVVGIDNSDGCVAPSAATIEDGSYAPLARPLFIYVNKKSLERPEVKAFVEFYMTDGPELVREVGYVAEASSTYQNNLDLVQGRVQPTPVPAAESEVMTKLSGIIEIDGSSTVAPVSQAVAEEFQKLHSDVRPVVGVSGTGAGFKRFTVGETDISDASRPIKPSEAEAAAANGIEYLELKVGTDGLSVMVNPENDFVDCLTVGELKAIWEPGSTVSTWQDVRSEWPDDEIRLYGPGTDSGTFDYFTEEIVGEARKSRPDYTPSEDDNVLVLGHLRRQELPGILRIRLLHREPGQTQDRRRRQRGGLCCPFRRHH